MTLRDEFLRVPVSQKGSPIPKGRPTRELILSKDVAEIIEEDAGADSTPEAALEQLREHGLDPAEWIVSGVRVPEWTRANGEVGQSKRFTFKRAEEAPAGGRVDIDELIEAVNRRPIFQPPAPQEEILDGALIIPLGDMQFGKDDDPESDALQNTLDALDKIAEATPWREEIAIVWLGDHVEGFVSQGGANAWRTKLTLNEQIRLTRRVMLYAVQLFANRCTRLIVAAVPGNHGEAVRFNDRGVTRYDDSHDTEALVAVAEACSLVPQFAHVEFLVPDNDELSVQFEAGGTRLVANHGHKWRPGKHWEWWQSQTFHGGTGADADILLAGHLHHLMVATDGRRWFFQIPALESGSKWWQHLKGSTSMPGIATLDVLDGTVRRIDGWWVGAEVAA